MYYSLLWLKINSFLFLLAIQIYIIIITVARSNNTDQIITHFLTLIRLQSEQTYDIDTYLHCSYNCNIITVIYHIITVILNLSVWYRWHNITSRIKYFICKIKANILNTYKHFISNGTHIDITETIIIYMYIYTYIHIYNVGV